MLISEAIAVPLSAWRVMPALAAVSVVFGLAVLWVFRRVSDQQRIRETKRRIKAHLYELRLFADEPALMWKSQAGLLKANARYLALGLKPALVIAVPAFLLFVQLDAYYGRAPLAVGDAAIVTAHWSRPLDFAAPAPVLQAPDGIVVETEAVRIPSAREMSWRIRPVRETSGLLRVLVPGGAVEKRIEAGDGPRYTSRRRVRSWTALIAEPTESRLPGSGIDWIEIEYPAATVPWMGLRFSWLVWVLVFSCGAILLFRRRFGVSF